MADDGDMVLGFAVQDAPAPPKRGVKRPRERKHAASISAPRRHAAATPAAAAAPTAPVHAPAHDEADTGAGAGPKSHNPDSAPKRHRGRAVTSRAAHAVVASSRSAGHTSSELLQRGSGAATVQSTEALLSGTSTVELGVQGRLVTAAARGAGLAPKYDPADPATHGVQDLKPTVVQSLFVPTALTGAHTVGVAATGSGKTLAFTLPLLQHLMTVSAASPIKREHGSYALVITPTRELAQQVANVISGVAAACPWVSVGVLTGGTKRKGDKARLRKGITVVVATPGRVLDHLQHTSCFNVSRLTHLVLDEVDRMLDLGFAATIAAILTEVQSKGGRGAVGLPLQILATSATLPPSACTALDELLKAADSVRPIVVVDAAARSQTPVTSVSQAATAAGRGRMDVGGSASVSTCDHHWAAVSIKWRMPTLLGMARFFVGKHSRKVLLFLSTRHEVEHVGSVLKALWSTLSSGSITPGDAGSGGGAFLGQLHGGMGAGDRQAAWGGFGTASHGMLVATDVAARGLDVPAVHLIVQCALPSDPADYVHRAGRTARMGRRGMSVLMLQPHEKEYLGVLTNMGVPVTEVSTTRWLKGLVGKVPPMSALPTPPPDTPEETEAEGTPATMRAVGIIKNTTEELAAERATLAAACAARRWQVWHECWVGWDAERVEAATAAFTSYTRAYSTHDKRLKTFLHVRALHLGHVAKAFGLKEPPRSVIGNSRAARAAAATAAGPVRRSDGVKSYARRKVNTMNEFES